MLKLKVGSTEMFDEETQEFTSAGGVELTLEHSLVALSKWESDFEKPFLDGKEKSTEELMGYIRAMCVDEVPEEIFSELSGKDITAINDYINKRMTATWFGDDSRSSGSREVITSELIYYWMVSFQIPFECETWHLNRLFTLIRVCNAKQEKPKKQSKAETARRRAELNAERRAKYNTPG